jgi:hypothetical protein
MINNTVTVIDTFTYAYKTMKRATPTMTSVVNTQANCSGSSATTLDTMGFQHTLSISIGGTSTFASDINWAASADL